MAIEMVYRCTNCDETSEDELKLCECCKQGHIYTNGEAKICGYYLL